MPKFKIVLSSSQRRKLAGVGLVLLLALAWTGVSVLQDTAVREAQARKDVTALAFEKNPDAWLNSPTEASAFEKAVASGQVVSVATSGSLVLYTDKAGKHHSTRLVDCGPGCSTNLLGRLGELSLQKGFVLTRTDIDPRTPSQKFNETLEGLGRLSLALLPVFLIAGLMFYQMRGGSLPFGGTKLAERPDTEFKDVIGADEAKKALRRVVAFMTDPAEYVRVGAHAPRGVLIDGPPGTGKTLLARALAKECGANFISVDGSHFSSMFFGAGIGKVKELFERARKNAPCIIFIDELDGVGKRSSGGDTSGAGDQEQNRIINRILVELDGFSPLENVVVVGATNHVDNIDKAMRRPGRFDMIVRTELPTTTEREALFGLYLEKVKAAEQIDLTSLARTATGMSPADIANCVNRAASYAAEGGAPEVTAELLYRSIETFQLGGEVSSAKGTLSPETLRRLAVHEGGHGLVAHVLDAGSVERVSIEPRGGALGVTYVARHTEEPLYGERVSIEPRGGALGVTYVARHTEEPLYGERELKSRLAMLLAGREAEMMVFGNTSSGAADDLKRASELATSMIGSFGFGKTFGLLSMAGVPKELIGPDIQKNVLDEARLLLEQAQAECQAVLTQHRPRLEALTHLLLDQETVSGQPLQAVLNA